MPNWCATYITIQNENEEELKRLEEELTNALKGNDSDFGDNWLGNLLLYLGYSLDEVSTGPISCRGSIDYIERFDDELLIDMQSAWTPHLLPIKLFTEKYAPESEILYTAEEPGFELYLTNDPEKENRISVFTSKENKYLDEIRDFPIKSALEYIGKATKKDIQNLEDANTALKEWVGTGNDYFYITDYQYMSLEDLN